VSRGRGDETRRDPCSFPALHLRLYFTRLTTKHPRNSFGASLAIRQVDKELRRTTDDGRRALLSFDKWRSSCRGQLTPDSSFRTGQDRTGQAVPFVPNHGILVAVNTAVQR
jgi:hypothetical protein